MLLALFVSPCLAQQTGREQELDLTLAQETKAKYLFKLTRYVRWPDGRFQDDGAPWVIGVLGDDPFGKTLDDVVAGQTVRGRGFEIRRFSRPETVDDELRACHVVWVSGSRELRLLDSLHDTGVLTVSDIDRFAERGGIVGLVLHPELGVIRPRVNRHASGRAGLRLYAKLLHLATIVELEDRE